jgi:hypothetical protein
MKTRLIVIIFSVFSFISVKAQNIGIGTSTPDASASLEIKSTAKGFLLPRMNTAAVNAISNPAKGLLVLDTATNQLMVNMGTPSSPNWQTIVFKSGWSLTGNSNINPATNFIGTLDPEPLRFRVNNINAGQIYPTGFNSSFGLGALNSITSGTNNTATGYNSLYFNTTGSSNTGHGYGTLFSNTSGSGNTATGISALYGNNGSYNTANGYASLITNSTGNNNSATGAYSLYFNQTGSDNVANGYQSLYSNTTGFNNIAIGSGTLQYNTFGNSNTAVGYNALNNNILGISNTGLGFRALYSNSTGKFNTALGNDALYSNSISDNNTAIGFASLTNNIDGYSNTAMGLLSHQYLYHGNDNIAIGAFTGLCSNVNTLYNSIVIGNSTCVQNSNYAILSTPNTIWNGGNVTWSTYSDRRIKRNIKEDVGGLSFIMKLRPITYNRSLSDESSVTGQDSKDYPSKYDIEKIRFTGFVAQEVEQAAQETGFDFSGITKPKTSTDLYSLSYESFVVPLVKAVQEQQVVIKQQQLQNLTLQTEVNLLKQKMESLSAIIDKLAQIK